MGRQLNRVRSNWRRIIRLKQRIEQLQAIAEKTTKPLSDMPRNPSGGSTENVWAELADQQSEYKAQLMTYLNSVNELEFELSVIVDDSTRAIMECRYVDNMPIKDIASLMHYDTRTVYRILVKGKRIYEKVYDDYETKEEQR